MRSVLLDTETTGLDPLAGDRVIEIAAIELQNDLPSGPVYHQVLDPGRPVPAEASAIHGFHDADLAGKPGFADIAADFLDFLGAAPIIAHNAPFDFGFLDAELVRAGRAVLDRGRMIDTLALAKQRFPGLPNSLDALCRRFSIDLSERASHNALLDCRLLAAVYLELTGGRQQALALATRDREAPTARARITTRAAAVRIAPSAAERARHDAFVARLKDPVWRRG